MEKVFLEVGVEYKKTGGFVPKYVIWESERYEISRYKEIGRRASSAGGTGTLYNCEIEGKARRLFFEIDRWFAEILK